ncbi:MAG: hypothetical protein ACOCYW_09735 [Roseicyclus sp.]
MTAHADARAFEAVKRLLQTQRAALREGRLKDLAAMVPHMERALAALPSRIDPSAQADLRKLAAENAALLQAASQGVAQARALRAGAAQVQLSTYDAAGRKSAHPPGMGRTLSRT